MSLWELDAKGWGPTLPYIWPSYAYSPRFLATSYGLAALFRGSAPWGSPRCSAELFIFPSPDGSATPYGLQLPPPAFFIFVRIRFCTGYRSCVSMFWDSFFFISDFSFSFLRAQ